VHVSVCMFSYTLHIEKENKNKVYCVVSELGSGDRIYSLYNIKIIMSMESHHKQRVCVFTSLN